MRLPFGFGRRSGSGDGARAGGARPAPTALQREPASSSSSASAAGASAGTGTDAAGGGPTYAWAELPAIQRSTGSMPLVAAPGVFVQRLPGSQGLPPIVQPLGHDVSPLATPGLVVLHARPIEAAPSRAIPAAVQRSMRGVRSRSSGAQASASAFEVVTPASDGDESAPAAGPAPEAPLAHVAAAAAPAPASPSRSLPTVSRLTIRMPDRPLTSAASAARPAALQRSSAGTGAGAATPSQAPATGMRRTPGPSATPPVVSRKAAAPEASPTQSASAAAQPVPQRTGLGAPLESLPASARPLGAAPARSAAPVVSRSAASPALPAASAAPTAGARSILQRSVARPSASHAGHQHADGGDAPATRAEGPEAPQLPVLPVTRPGDVHAAAAAPAPVVSRSAAQPEPRPTLGLRPLQPTVRVQRVADDEADDDETTDAMPSPWWAPEAARGHAGIGGTELGGDAPTVSRSVATGWDASPAPSFGSGRPSSSPRTAPTTATARPLQRMAALEDLPRARSAVGASPAAATTALAAATPASVAASPAGPAASPGLQRIVAAGPSASPGPAPAAAGQPVLQREAAPQSPAPTPAAQPDAGTAQARPSDRELEDLAQALFSRIRGRLRSELIHDREAKGLTFDNV